MEVLVRPWRESDAPALAALMQDKENMPYVSNRLPDPYTVADALSYIALMNSGEDLRWGGAVTVDGAVAGNISVFRKEDVLCKTGELGYIIGRAFSGRGVATRAVEQMCAEAFARSDLNRIQAEVMAPNVASARVLEKAGFLREGTLRRAVLKNGGVLDLHIYGLLRP